MSTRPPHGTLTLSVDLEHDHLDVGLAEQRALDDTAARLVDLVARHAIAATWGVADPAVSAARTSLIAAPGTHEWALLGDATWVGSQAGRGRFARELARRVATAAAAGLTLRTLALRTALPVDHADLVLKEGLVAVRQPLDSFVRRGESKAHVVRHGLWGFTAARVLPEASRWLPGGGGLRAARYEIDKAITERGLVHLAIDAARLSTRGAASLRVVQQVLEHAARRRQSGLLEISTLGAIAMRLAAAHQGQPSRSILRPAA